MQNYRNIIYRHFQYVGSLLKDIPLRPAARSPPARRVVAQARSAGIMCPACPEDGGHDTFSPPDRHRSAPCTSGRRWPWHIQWRFCSPDVRRIRMPMSDQSSFPSQICALPARRMAAQARSAAILCTARPKVGGPGTFSGHYVSRLPGGGWLWLVLQRLCSLRAGG